LNASAYRLFVPSARDVVLPPGAPLIVALHGCTQSAADFATGTRFDQLAERAGAFVLYPEQSQSANPQRCWNWFLPENQRRAGPEPAAVLEEIARVRSLHPIDPERIFVTGLSAGAAFAAILAEQAPDVFAAAALMAGVALHTAHDAGSAFRVMQDGPKRTLGTDGPSPAAGYERLRVLIWAGADDRRVIPLNSAVLAGQFARLMGLGGIEPLQERDGAREIARWRDASGSVRIELDVIDGLAHAWSGGSARGSFTAPAAPRFSDELFAFFLVCANSSVERDPRAE
jgi:poly(hydroxyalkanoate) depolymerase family esterase